MGHVVAAHRVDVEFFINHKVLGGPLALPPGIRLSDLLNGMCARPSQGDDFIEFVRTLDSGAKENPVSYVRRAAIQFAAVLGHDVARGTGTSGNVKSYPVVPKSARRFAIQLESYELSGGIHCAGGQDVLGLMNGPAPFLPLTDVTIVCDNRLPGSRPF